MYSIQTLPTCLFCTRIICSVPVINTATMNLQTHLNNLQNWFNLWEIKMNEIIYHFLFTIQRCALLTFNYKIISIIGTRLCKIFSESSS